MNKLHRRGYLAISTIVAASALCASAPAGASAAAEESGGGSTPAETVVEPSGNSTQPAAPATTEWTPQDAEGGTSSSGAPPLEHGSSVGSGVVTQKAGSHGEAPSYTPESSGSYEPEPSAPSAPEEPASTPPAGSGVHSVQPTATATKASKAVDMAVGAAASLGRSASSQGSGIGSAPRAAVASLAGSGDRASTSSYALPLLALMVLGLILGFAGVRLMRHRRRMRLEALGREQAATWESALRRAGLGQASGASEPSAQPLQRVSVG